MTTSKSVEAPVLIVGGGPAGLVTSLLLSRFGVDSLLVEKHPAASPLPRARGVHSRAMEILRVLGIETDMRRLELPIDPGAEWRRTLITSPVREDVFAAPDGVPVSPCEGLSISQDVFESVLREHARGFTSAELRLGTELVSFDVGPEGVNGVLLDRESGQLSSVRARYMVAADGARSGIRERLGIGMDGAADLGSQRMFAFRADLTRWTSQTPRGIYFLTDANAVLIWTHPDHRWVLHIPDNGSATTDTVATIREAIGDPDVPVEVLARTVWTAAAQTATTYAHGPTFLVGDAAHRFPPAGATGVSTAMHDAHNLSWKLAAALSGRVGATLLDTYCQEREPVGRRNVEETGAAWSRIWRPSGAPFAGRSLRQIDMGYQYRSAAVIQDGSPDADPAGADYAPSAAPGCRAPHLWIETQRGRLSTIDLFDRDFVLLTAEPGALWRVAAETVSLELDVPVVSHLISEPDWHYLYGIGPAGAVLVRPDGHVVWRRRTLPTRGEPAAQAQFHAALATAIGAGRVAAAELDHDYGSADLAQRI